jgi:uncharacterized protein YndB with AHSA1/START domain
MPPRDVRIEAQRRLPVSLQEGFDYITDPARWPEYWPSFVRLDPSSRWRSPGDRARITLRMLGRDVELDMTLSRIEPRRLVEYTSEQRGLPGARHWRHFENADGQLDYRVAVEYSPRPGWRGLLDRTVVRRAIARTVDETMANLARRFA